MKKKIHDFCVLHYGWDMDNDACVTEDKYGYRELETTNHGGKCKMSKEELFKKISEMETNLIALRKAAELMGYEVDIPVDIPVDMFDDVNFLNDDMKAKVKNMIKTINISA